MSLVFLLFLSLAAGHYFIFPLLVFGLSVFFRRGVQKESITPTVTLIVAAYNEEKVIQAKLRNIEALDYPYGRLEVIIVSDGSSDRTPQLVEQYTGRPVRNLYHPLRRGKTHAIERAVAVATGEILVFSDANTYYSPQAIRSLASNFADTSVGAVSGQKRIFKSEDRQSSLGDRLFWAYESRLKARESALGSIPTGDGEIFAVRKSLYRHIPAEIINDDMAITLNVIGAGKRVVYEPAAISEEVASLTLRDDFQVKARMVAGGYQILSEYGKVLTAPTWFALQFFFHKTLRYLMPLLLLGLLVTSFALARRSDGMTLFLVLQLCCYALAGIGAWRAKQGRSPGVFYVPYYYCLMNLAALQGLVFYIQKKSSNAIWKKAVR